MPKLEPKTKVYYLRLNLRLSPKPTTITYAKTKA